MHQPVQDYGVDHAYPVQKHESYVVVVGDKVQKGVEVIVRERVLAEGLKNMVEKEAECVVIEAPTAKVP